MLVVKYLWFFFLIIFSVIGIVKIIVGFIMDFRIVFVNRLVLGVSVSFWVSVKLFMLFVSNVVVNIVGLVLSVV